MRVGTSPGATGGGIWHEPVVRDIVVGTARGCGGRETACGAAEDARPRPGNSAAPEQDVTLGRRQRAQRQILKHGSNQVC